MSVTSDYTRAAESSEASQEKISPEKISPEKISIDEFGRFTFDESVPPGSKVR